MRPPLRSKRRKVKANSRMAAQASNPAPSSRLQEIISDSNRIEELSDTDNEYPDNEYEDIGIVEDQHEAANMEYINNLISPIRDSLETETSITQDETLAVVLPFLEGNPNDFPLNAFGLPKLQREKHAAFLHQALGDYPAQMAAMDAARPWLVYWSLQGLTALGYDISEFQDR
jgi:protein farnesyltransferase subunit beta